MGCFGSKSGNRFNSASIRLQAIAKYFSFFSMPMNCRPVRTQATPVVPAAHEGVANDSRARCRNLEDMLHRVDEFRAGMF